MRAKLMWATVVTMAATAAVMAVVVSTAGAATPVAISPTGTVHTPTPTIQVKFIGSNTYMGPINPSNMALSLDGRPLECTLEPPVSAFEVTATATVTEPLSEGLHLVRASSGTGSDTWTFIYLADPDAEHNPITDVYPLGLTDDQTWYNTWGYRIGFTLPPGTLEQSTTVASIAIDGVSYGTTRTDNTYSTWDMKYLGGSILSPPPYTRPPAMIGTHEVVATASDGLGNSVSQSWTYHVNDTPGIGSVLPADGSRSNSTTCTVLAQVLDTVGGLDPEGVVMLVNDVAVAPECAQTGANLWEIRYEPVVPFLNESTVRVSLSFTDTFGTANSRAWQFQVNEFPDMATAANLSNASCTSCHATTFNDIHIDLAQSELGHYTVLPDGTRRQLHDGYANCLYCHQQLDTVRNDPGQFTDHEWDETVSIDEMPGVFFGRFCEICHVEPDGQLHNGDFNYLWHGSTTEFTRTGLPTGSAVTSPRESFDCVYCHQKGSAGPSTFGPHDVGTAHAIDIDEDCQGCHSRTLTSEHAIDGRADAAGAAITCGTCHSSADPIVKSASGRQWLGETDRVVLQHTGGAYSVYPEDIETRQWSYRRGGVSVPVTKVKLHLKGTAAFRLDAYYNGTWNRVLDVAARDSVNLSTGVYSPPVGMLYAQDVVRELTLPGATEFKLAVVPTRFGFISNGGRMGLTVVETAEPAPVTECATCHEQAAADDVHAAEHDETLADVCAGCHDANLVTEHVADQGLACRTCHQSADPAVAAAIAAGDGSCAACHSVDAEAHPHPASAVNSSTAEFADACAECHATDLIAEHARSTSAGHEDPCASCHASVDPRVVAAIASGGASCDGCHEGAGHETDHATGLDGRCASCHGSSLGVTHLTPPDPATLSAALQCTTCHDVAGPSTAIAFSGRACGSCHSAGHAQSFATTMPTDVYLDPVSSWSGVLPARAFEGESWMPLGAIAREGRVVLGGRSDAGIPGMWASFRTEMEALGWTVPLEAPDTSGTSLTATLTKNDERCLIVLYAGDAHASLAASAAGTRAEIVWWSIEE